MAIFQTASEICRRASGRRAYNARRSLERERRLVRVTELLLRMGGAHRIGGRYGVQAQIARLLGVSESTISRDLQALQKEWQRQR